MRKTMICFCGLLVGTAAIAATAAELKDTVFERLQAAAQKQREHKTKTYSGDFAAILAARIADVNEVISDIGHAKGAAVSLAVMVGDPNDIRGAVQRVIDEKTKKVKQEKKKGALDFMADVESVLADPNSQPDPNDIEEAARLADFERACLELVTEMIAEADAG
jgi:hypothetical protein